MNHSEHIMYQSPEPRQLHKQSSRIMGEAAERGKLKRMSLSGKACFFIDETELLQDNRDDAYSLRHRLAARVAKQTVEVPVRTPFRKNYNVGIPEWHMQLFETQWFEHDMGAWVGARSLYRFAWNTRAVTCAERATIVVPSEQGELGDAIDRLSAINQQVDTEGFVEFVHAQNEYEHMTRADVGQLEEAVNDYFSVATR